MVQNFIKRKEDFVCKVCGSKVSGSGYTNHCPNCLWSKHLDLEIPGDRKSDCKGLMEAIGVEIEHGEYIIVHRCQKCGKITKNKSRKEDNFEEILKIVKGNK